MEENLLKEEEQAEIIAHVIREYDSSKEFTTKKRRLFKEREARYLNISDQTNKVYNRLIFSVHQTLLALEVKEKPSVKFSVEGLWFDELEDNIQSVANHDFTRMGLEEKKERVREHKYRYGVGIEVFDSWNSDYKHPNVFVPHPTTWVCDPEFNINDGYRFHGFDMEVNLEDLKEEYGYFNIDLLKDKHTKDIIDNHKGYVTDTRELNRLANSTKHEIYHHYTTYDGKKILVTLGANRTVLIRCKEIEPITPEEKKNPSLIQFPVIIRNWIPIEFDPFGVCLFDILEDKQAMIQLFQNLNRIKAENEAYGDLFLYDPEVIQDVSQLGTPKIGGARYLKANLSKITQLPIQEVPRGQIKPDAINMPSILQSQSNIDLGMDQRSLGVSEGGSITATENQRVQANANLRQLLGLKRDARAEKKFWKYRYRMYQEYFTGKKQFKIPGVYGSDWYELQAKQFITYQNIDVLVESVQEAEERNEREKLAFMAMYPMISQSQNVPKYGKIMAMREMLKLNGMAKEKIKVIVPETADEIKAKMWLELINRNEEAPKITDLNEDHWTYISIYQRARDTDAKYKAISERMDALAKSGQQNMQMPGQEQGQQLSSQSLSQLASTAPQSNTLSNAQG